ncbi:hypothetical protein ETU08_00625 [Apibacter muscae]|uniref:hypothetical protein n=1 Tax=Apibacter muscae TaxID=2509004 RepID=UPI0011AD2830|nr:hypothetical protein [Apibacter muscae]TWP31538.1 hypothetical protein ETU08_00625 [Apibacter muscae]
MIKGNSQLIVIVIFFIMFFCNCESKKNAFQSNSLDFFEISQNEIELKKKTVDIQQVSKERIKGVFLNNPYKFIEKDYILLYANGKLVYRGNFTSSFVFDIDDKITSIRRGLVNFSFEIIKGDKIAKISNKSVVKWDDKNKFLYIAFFPTNQNTEQIVFIPVENSLM